MRKLIAFLLLLSFVPLAMGHAAPAERSFETRALHDHNDDSLVVLAGKHGFDTIALDIREGYLRSVDEPVMIFKLVLNGGCSTNPAVTDACGDLHEDILVTAGGMDHTFRFTTSDGGDTWSGDFELITGPHGFVPADGDRFFIEGYVPFSSLGIAAGDVLSDFFVEGYHGSEPADNMPQGAGDPSVADPLGAAFNIGTYTTKAPDFYLDVSADDANITIVNLLDVPQTVTVGLDDGSVDFDGSSANELTLELGAEASTNVSFMVEHETARILVTSTLGGYGEVEVMGVVEDHHPETHDSLDTGAISVNGTYAFVFAHAGTWQLHEHNSGAMMEVIVHDEAGAQTHEVALVVGENGTEFAPHHLEVHLGEVVTFVNQADGPVHIMGSASAEPHKHDDHDETEDAPGVPLAFVGLALLAVALRRKA